MSSFSRTEHFYFKTFAKAAVIPYIGGTVAHSLRLVYRFPIVEAPSWIHWAIVIVGSYASIGFILFAGRINFRGLQDKILYGCVIFHLGTSVILHAYSIVTHDNEWMGIFSINYSYFAIFYFVVLGIYCKKLSKRIDAVLNPTTRG